MNKWAAARRVAFAVIAALLVVSFVFGFIQFTDDPNEALIQYQMVRKGGASVSEFQEAIDDYRAERGRNRPLFDQYVDFVVGTATLNWGVSPTRHAFVTDLLAQSLPYTALWVLPAMGLALVGGLAIGLFSALTQYTILDRLGTTATYVGLSLPGFWLGPKLATALHVGWRHPEIVVGPAAVLGPGPLPSFSVDQMLAFALPSLTLAASLVAGQVRFVRSEALEYANAEFIKLVRAKGVSRLTVARHVGRNAAIPLLSLFFGDMLRVLVINVFVLEYVFNIPGIGTLAFSAFVGRDLPTLLGVTTVVMFVGVLGNLFQDLVYVELDPRVESIE